MRKYSFSTLERDARQAGKQEGRLEGRKEGKQEGIKIGIIQQKEQDDKVIAQLRNELEMYKSHYRSANI